MVHYEVQCACKAVFFTLTGEPPAHGYCHCRDCQTCTQQDVYPGLVFTDDALKIVSGQDRITAWSYRDADLRRCFCQVLSSLCVPEGSNIAHAPCASTSAHPPPPGHPPSYFPTPFPQPQQLIFLNKPRSPDPLFSLHRKVPCCCKCHAAVVALILLRQRVSPWQFAASPFTANYKHAPVQHSAAGWACTGSKGGSFAPQSRCSCLSVPGPENKSSAGLWLVAFQP